MVRIDGKAFRLFVPALTAVLISGESLKRFESLGEVIGHQEALQMFFQVVMSLVVILFHGGVFERAVHAFYLAIGPGVVGFGQSMVDAILLTDTIKEMMECLDIALAVGEVNAVIS
jgi:NAD dependent epimerase/dehydratase family enzyme